MCNKDCFNCQYEDCIESELNTLDERMQALQRELDSIARLLDPNRSKHYEAQLKYYSSEKGKANIHRKNTNEKGRERMRRYNHSEKGKARSRLYEQTEKRKAYRREWQRKKRLEEKENVKSE